MFPANNNTGIGIDDRTRRTQALRIMLILFLCGFLLFSKNNLAQPPSKHPSASPETNTASLAREEIAILNNYLKPFLSKNENPKNISGTYKGSWTMDSTIENLNTNTTKHRTQSGFSILQLRTVAVPGVHLSGLQFVYGVMKIYATSTFDKTYAVSPDTFYTLQGVYLPSQASVTMLSTNSKHRNLFITLPANMTTKTFNTTSIATATSVPVDHADVIAKKRTSRRLQAVQTMSEYSNIVRGLRRMVSEFDESILHTANVVNPPVASSVLPLHRALSEMPATLVMPAVGFAKAAPSISVETYPVASSALSLLLATPSLPSPLGFGDDLTSSYFKTLIESSGGGVCSFGVDMQLNFKQPADAAKDTSLMKLKAEILGSVSSSTKQCHDQTPMHISVADFEIQYDALMSKVRLYTLAFTLVCAAQMCLLWQQLKYQDTSAQASKVSILCVTSQAVIDAGICVVHLLMSSVIPSMLFYYVIWIASLKLVIFCILEMKLVLQIYQARYSLEVAANGWRGLRHHLATLHARFYAALFAMMIIVDVFYMKPYMLIFLLYSFWVPQIVYNAVNNTRKPFFQSPAGSYAVLMSLTRLFIPLYIYGCPQNFIATLGDHSEYTHLYNPTACLVLVAWLACQVIVLYLQDRMGARFFLPAAFHPVVYNYHRAIPQSEEAANEIEAGGKECVICYNVVDNQSQDYMITPCNHLFHDDCLSQWMDVKLECPVCRAPLPPKID